MGHCLSRRRLKTQSNTPTAAPAKGRERRGSTGLGVQGWAWPWVIQDEGQPFLIVIQLGEAMKPFIPPLIPACCSGLHRF